MGATNAALAAIAISRMSPEERKAIADFFFALAYLGGITCVFSWCIRGVCLIVRKFRKEKTP